MEIKPNCPLIMQTHVYKGITYPNVVTASNVDAMKDFTVRPDDVWIVTYPKSGTHWVMEIAGLILTRGDPDKIDRSLYSSTIEMVNLAQKFPRTREEEIANPPDMTPFTKIVDKAPSPRVIMTHLCLDLLPSTLIKTGRVIYVARNPKDVLNSLHTFLGVTPFYNLPWEFQLNGLMDGSGRWGPWPEHVKAFWDIRNEKNVLFLFYENMKKDPMTAVRQVAELMEVQLSEEELQKVVEHSSFSGMKKSYQKTEERGQQVAKAAHGDDIAIMHKGVIGDWKNRFTVAQNEAMDAWLKEQLADSDIDFDFV